MMAAENALLSGLLWMKGVYSFVYKDRRSAFLLYKYENYRNQEG
jgi:hypothetical protein